MTALTEIPQLCSAVTALIDIPRFCSELGNFSERRQRNFDERRQQLRTSPEGRAGLEDLTRHAAAGVRLLAASDCLPFAPEIGEPVLEAIESSPGLHAVSAKYTLKSFRAGTLNLGW